MQSEYKIKLTVSITKKKKKQQSESEKLQMDKLTWVKEKLPSQSQNHHGMNSS